MSDGFRFHGTLRFEEYLEVHKLLAARRRLFLRSIFIVYGAGILIYKFLSSPAKPDPVFIVIGSLLVIYGTVISPLQFRYRVKRNWDRYPRIKKEFDITVSALGVESKDDRDQPSLAAWDSFLRFGESPSLFLLYLSPLLPVCLPKRLVPERDLSAVRELCKGRVVAR